MIVAQRRAPPRMTASEFLAWPGDGSGLRCQLVDGEVRAIPDNPTDAWANVWAYSTIPTVREILIVHSTRIAAELLRRLADGAWPASPEEIRSGAMMRVAYIGFERPLIEVYEGTHLGET